MGLNIFSALTRVNIPTEFECSLVLLPEIHCSKNKMECYELTRLLEMVQKMCLDIISEIECQVLE